MATVVLNQATDMTPGALGLGPASVSTSLTEIDVIPGGNNGYFDCLGTFTTVGISQVGTIVHAVIDTPDFGNFPNIEITNFSYQLTASAFNTSFAPGNVGVILAELLSGNDTLYGSAGADAFDGYNGIDTVIYAGASTGLFAGLEDGVGTGGAAGDTFFLIENLYGSAFNDILYGSAVANRLTGAGGNDLLVGKDGGDVLDGGAGSDTAGYDISFTPTLRADLLLRTTNTGAAAGDIYVSIENLAGSSFNDILLGDNFANVLSGAILPNISSGNDLLYGRGGNDTLRGYDGNDRLEGDAGIDVLTGGAGSDTFVFNATPNAATNRDIVIDYVHGLDHLQLENAVFAKLGAGAGIHALNPALLRLGSVALDGNDYLVYNRTTGLLYYDANANVAGGAIPIAAFSNHAVLTAGDFVVI